MFSKFKKSKEHSKKVILNDRKNFFIAITFLNLVSRWGLDSKNAKLYLAKFPKAKESLESTLMLFRQAYLAGELTDKDEEIWRFKRLMEGYVYWQILQNHGRKSTEKKSFLVDNPQAENDLQMYREYAQFELNV